MDLEVKTESSMGGSDSQMAMNGLKYRMPQTLSSSVNRTFIKQYSQRQEYKEGDTIVFDINSGSRYIDPANCALKLEVQTDGAASTFSSDAGAIALINEVRIFAKNGTELDRIQEVNQYVHTTTHYKETTEAVEKYGQLSGAETGTAVSNTAFVTLMIPMGLVSGLFNPIVKGMKLPAALISGARIELVLENASRAFTDAGVTGYTVKNAQVLMLASQLNDTTQAMLIKESSDNGLEYTYPRVFTTTETTSQTSVNIQVKKAVAQGLRAITVPILSANVNAGGAASFTSPATDCLFDNFQYRVGANFYPQQKAESLPESYYVTMASYGKNSTRGWNAGALSVTDYSNERYAVGAGFETDERLNLSGVPINNSSTLELQGTVTPLGEVKYFVFMEYVAVSRSFLSKTTVKI